MAPAIEADSVPSPVRAGTGNAARFPRPRGTVPCRPVGPGDTEASARPGGCEAPAGGGSGAGRGLWPPAGVGSAWCCGRGDGPGHLSGETAFVSVGGDRKRDPRFPRPRATVPCRPTGPGTRQASARPGGREAPAVGGAGACLSESCRSCRLLGLVRGDGGHRPPGLAGCGPCRALVQGTVARGVAPAFRPVPDGYMSARLARQARE